VKGVRRVWGAQHHFVTAYCPWANGTVEVVNRMLLRVLKSMSSEKKLKPSQWTLLVKQVQAALNLQPSAFLALPVATPLKMFYAEKISGMVN
jgi:IS30 family transposase